ncbi:MAG: 2-hydroxyacyl-CoA dehydratase [Candidatus Izemoplasma sp.]
MAELIYNEEGRLLFTEEMRLEYTILVPQMAPYHFEYLLQAMNSEGFNAKLLKNDSFELIQEGLKYSHNDICVPAMLVIGQFIDAIKSGEFDVHKIALVITQTGGGCRASNYVALLRKSLIKAGYEFIPIISLNASGMEPNPGFKITARLLFKLINSLTFGDIAMQVVNEIRPYELNEGDTFKALALVDKLLTPFFESKKVNILKFPRKLIKEVITIFDGVAIDRSVRKPRVGVVGEIYVKYSPLGNNNLENMLIDEGCEVITPSIFEFFLYTFDSSIHDIKKYGGSKKQKIILQVFIVMIESRRKFIRNTLGKHGYYKPLSYKELKKLAKGVINYGTHSGEGWLLTAEMLDLIHMDAPNIVCTQPFGCLPNHIVGKGMFKKIKELHPESNIIAIDYDTSAPAINQINRIKLMVANAYENLEKQ